MNLNFLQWAGTMIPDNSDEFSTELLDKIYQYGFLQLVKEPTRFWPGCAPSGIDHIYTNRPDKITSVTTSFTCSSDHKIVSAIRQ